MVHKNIWPSNGVAYASHVIKKSRWQWTEAVGEGVTDFPAIAKALKGINYSGRAAVELAFDHASCLPRERRLEIQQDYVRKGLWVVDDFGHNCSANKL